MDTDVRPRAATDGLKDECVWRELERVMAGYARRAAATPPHEPAYFRIPDRGGSWCARCTVLAQDAERTVVLVAVEYRARFFPRVDELCSRFHLTRTEARVALMLAERRTNREIATALFVTEHTARRHTEKVLLRLGIRSRTAVRGVLEEAAG